MKKEIKIANKALIKLYFEECFFNMNLTDDDIRTLEQIKRIVELALGQKKEVTK